MFSLWPFGGVARPNFTSKIELFNTALMGYDFNSSAGRINAFLTFSRLNPLMKIMGRKGIWLGIIF
jgi:hypothetical protein